MYSDFKTISTYYDALYVNGRKHAPEDARVKALLTRHGLFPQADLLVLACGTGGHIPYFKDDYTKRLGIVKPKMIIVIRQHRALS
jgi:6-phosphogluconolactonase/glucosamine-6-phosphate isomerase/deaminase